MKLGGDVIATTPADDGRFPPHTSKQNTRQGVNAQIPGWRGTAVRVVFTTHLNPTFPEEAALPDYVFTINGPTQSITADCDGTLEEVAEQLAKDGFVLGRFKKLGFFSAPSDKDCAILAHTVITITPA
jgi:hypothetical protein